MILTIDLRRALIHTTPVRTGQATLVGPVIARLGEPRTEWVCGVGLALCYTAMAGATQLWQVGTRRLAEAV